MPLIVFGVISGASSIDPKSNGRAGGIAIAYSLGLSLFSSLLGLLLCLAIKPGSFMQSNGVSMKPKTNLKTQDIFADMVRNIFTDNIVRATMQKARTDYVIKENILLGEGAVNGSTHSNITEDVATTMTRTLVYANTTNLLGVLFFCIVFGMAVGRLGEKAVIIHHFTEAGRSVTILILQWFMWYCPIGVASLIISALAHQKNLGTVMAQLSMLTLTATLGNILQSLFLYPLIFFVLTRRNPIPLLIQCGRLAIMACTLTSSIIIMPEYYRICKAQGYDRRLTSMVVPFITTISSSGSALYVSVASLFLVQYGYVTVDASQLTVIVILGAFSCFAVPAAPSGSIIIVMLVIQTINVPSELAGILFGIDWFLDRVRTTANAISKAVGSALINELCQEDLMQLQDSPSHREQSAGTQCTNMGSHLLSSPIIV